jgi:hypothetical protein
MIVAIKWNFRIFTQSSLSIKQRVCTYSLNSITLFHSLALNPVVLSLSVYESETNMIMLSLLVSPLRKKTLLILALSRKSRGRQAGVAIILALYFLLFLNCVYTYSA